MEKIIAKEINSERFVESAGDLETTSFIGVDFRYDVPEGYIETKKEHPTSIEAVKPSGEHIAWLTKAFWVCGGQIFDSLRECSQSEWFHPNAYQVAIYRQRAEEIAAQQSDDDDWGE
jgi:hypothetical protein